MTGLTSDEALLAPHNKRAAEPRFVSLDAAGRRAYKAGKQRERRAKLKQAAEAGKPRPTIPTLRAALADAASMILRDELPGAEIIRQALAETFQAPGIGLTVTSMTRSGRLGHKMLEEDSIPPQPARAAPAALSPASESLATDSSDHSDFQPPAFLLRRSY